jgi:glycosyltransferase involved in cell wall biosynthesis
MRRYELDAVLKGLTVLNLLFWGTRAWIMFQGERRLRKLKDVPPAETTPEHPLPRLAVVVPSLNEEIGIRAALESLAMQDYPDLMIFPINDRSTDRTGEIMDEVASRHPHIHPIHVKELPAEWIGKNHANAVGAREAILNGAEWILFTDGDVQFGPTALRKAFAYIQQKASDHLAVTPELIPGGFWEETFVTTFIVWFMTRFQPWEVENTASKRFIGIGAFNLLRSEAYQAIGGHEKLALTVADDMALGKLVKGAGFRQSFLDGYGEVRVRWQNGLWAAVRGLYKNTFSTFDFSWLKTLGSALFVFVFNVLPYGLPLLTEGWTRWVAAFALAEVWLVYARSTQSLGRPFLFSCGVALGAGFGGALMVWLMLASAALTTLQGGVVWRGTLYPTQLLRNRQVRV